MQFVLFCTLEQPANNLLAALPPSDYERLVPHLKLVTLSTRQILYEAGEAIAQVYFPNNAVVYAKPNRLAKVT